MKTKIKQQEAAVEMIRQMVSAKRARVERLEAAINELNRLKAEESANVGSPQSDVPTVARPSRKVVAIMQDVNSDIYALKHSALSHEAARLRRDQAELSNMLHKIPAEQPCPELVDKILGLHQQIETIWDQKHFLDRNRHDGPAAPAHDQQVAERAVDVVESKAELSVKLQQFREKRSKLRKKLEDPKASLASKSKWEIELAQVESGIEEVNTKRALL